MKSSLFNLFTIAVFAIRSEVTGAEKGFKCYGCIAGPYLTTTTPSDENCKNGNLERGDQYICTLQNSRNAATLEYLSPEEIERISERAEVEFSFGCVKATFSLMNSTEGHELFTVRGCIYDQYTAFEAVCDTEDYANWLGMMKPNPANLPDKTTVQDFLPKNVDISTQRCTCFTDACNSSNRLTFISSSLFLMIGYLFIIY